MEAVLNGGPWSFDNNMLILEQVQLGMQIEQIPLYHVNMWVQVHDLPTGLMKERVGISLANYIGSFVEYDKNNNSSFWRQYMRLRVRIDVRLPLKKDTKVKDKEGNWCTVKFKYEKLGIFCFVCGIMGHAENKCEVRFSMERDDGVREWSAEIRAESRRQGGRFTSRWLREEGGGNTEDRGSAGGRQPQTPAGSTSAGPMNADLASNSSPAMHNRISPNQPAFTTRQENSMPIITKAHMSNQFPNNNNSNNNQIIPPLTPHTSTSLANNITVPSFLTNKSLSNPVSFPNIHSSLNNNQLTPFILNRPAADNINTQSLSNQNLTFNSQPLTRAPQATKNPSHKGTRASLLKGVTTRPTTHR
jgi:14-3-3 protein epsilon